MTQLTPSMRPDRGRKTIKMGVTDAKGTQESKEALEGTTEDRVVEEAIETRATTPASVKAKAMQLSNTVDEVEQYVQRIQRDLHFSVDEQSGETCVTVTDIATEEVIRHIPPEELIDAQKVIDKATGLLIQVKV